MKTMNPKYVSNSAPQRPAHAAPGNPAPVKTLRLGRLKAAIWENGAEERTFLNVTFARTYLGEDKKFRESDSFGREDLLLLSKLADQAHTFVCERSASPRPEE
jgi:hypothetical protein